MILIIYQNYLSPHAEIQSHHQHEHGLTSLGLMALVQLQHQCPRPLAVEEGASFYKVRRGCGSNKNLTTGPSFSFY